MSSLSLDIKLGLRLLAKHAVLTLSGSLAIAFAIWAGAISFEFFRQVVRPSVGLEDGGELVAVVMADAAAGSYRDPTLQDFSAWRDGVNSIEGLGAFRSLVLNLIVGDGAGVPVEVAEISASAFRMMRARPLMGRALSEGDEAAGAAPVVVIGYEVWRDRFSSDPNVIGLEVRIGNVRHTVVGVMPDGFRFPVAHELWIPFKLRPLDYAPGESPSVKILGRLPSGTDIESAEAELSVLRARSPRRLADGQEHLRPRVMPYVRSVFGSFWSTLTLRLTSANVLVLLLLFLVCGNVALLMFARAAARESELVVRTALGASRWRINGQLFVEALVLAVIAGVLGLAAAQATWSRVFGVIAREIWPGGSIPFWFSSDLSATTVFYAVLLILLAGAVSGLLPGWKVTRGLASRLRRIDASHSGLRFGGAWTVLIVGQVTVMAVVPVFLFINRDEAARLRHMELGFPTDEYLTATITVDQDRLPGGDGDDPVRERLARANAELERRLEAEPGIIGVAFASRLPLMYHPPRRIEVDEGGIPVDPEGSGYPRVSNTAVAPDFFDVMMTPVLSGRDFYGGDLAAGARSVIVNESFVRLVLGGSNPVGRRLRYPSSDEMDGGAAAEPWYEIVGVVRDMGIAVRPENRSGIYHPLAAGGVYPVRVVIHTRGDPSMFASRLRAIATDVHPRIQLHEVMSFDDSIAADLRIYRVFFWITVAMTAVVLLLSLAGIYAALSFTVSRRTREVGIRMALGGDSRQVASAILRRSLVQVVLGILIGLVLATGIAKDGRFIPIVGLYGSAVVVVCALAVMGPLRRVFQIQPREALRVDP